MAREGGQGGSSWWIACFPSSSGVEEEEGEGPAPSSDEPMSSSEDESHRESLDATEEADCWLNARLRFGVEV